MICTGKLRRAGFTLIEMLVTLFILMILASVALPMTRNIIKDQRNNRATQILLSFIESTRNQAIAENRSMGLIFDRMDSVGFGRSASITVRQLRGLPPYTGETAKARATLINNGSGTEVNAAQFDPIENQLLLLSAQILADSTRADATAPIRPGDRLELPGGRMVTIRTLLQEPPIGPLSLIRVTFNLREPSEFAQPGTAQTYPLDPMQITDPPQRVPYAIHRSPIVSNTRTVTLPRGTAIDFNYSGLGISGNEFAPNLSDDTVTATGVVVHFDANGRITRVGNDGAPLRPPVSQLFFCVGDIDGVRPDDLFATERRARANILRPNSAWIVMNPATGRITSSPFSSVTPPGGDFTTMTVGSAIEQARLLANLGDTLE